MSRTCLLVPGMHRTGTSAFARLANLLGAALPAEVMPGGDGNPKGHWEPHRLVRLNDEMLAELGSGWDDVRPLGKAALQKLRQAGFERRLAAAIEDEYGAAELFVLKDPRICRLLPLYVGALERLGVSPKVVVTIRHPSAVARSLTARKSIPVDTEAYARLIWARNVVDAERATRDLPRLFVPYPDYLGDWRRWIERIEKDLGVVWPVRPAAAARAIDTFLDDADDHHRIDEDVEADRLEPSIARAWRALKTLSRDPGAAEARKALDKVRAEIDEGFDGAAAVAVAEFKAREARLWRANYDLGASNTSLAVAAAETGPALAAAKIRIAEMARSLETTTAELAAARTETRTLEVGAAERLAAVVGERDALEAELKADRDALKTELEADRDARIAEVRAEAERREAAATAARDALRAQLEADRDALKTELEAERDARIAEVRAEAERHVAAALAESETLRTTLEAEHDTRLAAMRIEADGRVTAARAERDQLRAEIDAAAATHVAALAARSSELYAAREREVALGEALAAADARIAALAADLEAQHHRSSDLALQLQGQMAALEKLVAESSALHAELGRATAELGRRASRITDLEAELAAAREAGAAAEARVSALESELTHVIELGERMEADERSARARALRLQRAVERTRAELAATAGVAADLGRRLAEAEGARDVHAHSAAYHFGIVAEMRETLRATERRMIEEVDAYRRQLAAAEVSMERAREGVAALLGRLADVQSSTSWRLTAPIRAMKRVLSGQRGGDTQLTAPITLPPPRAAAITAATPGRSETPLVFFTICSRNFTAFARTLHDTLRRFYPGEPFYAALADSAEPHGPFDPNGQPFPFITLAELDLPEWREMAERYNITEFNTAIKPFVFQLLMARHPGASIVYLDPDIIVTSRMVELEDAFADGASVVLTPHLTEPAENVEVHDQKMLVFGAYNLGFLGVGAGAASLALMQWWGRRLVKDCTIRLEEGIFVDQKWADLFPSYIGNARILRHPGYNVAYWNISQRRIERSAEGYLSNGAPLRFAHFSGSKLEDPAVYSRHTGQFHAGNIGDLKHLLDEYRERIFAAGHREFQTVPYAFSWDGAAGVNLHTPRPEHQAPAGQAPATAGTVAAAPAPVPAVTVPRAEDVLAREVGLVEVMRSAARVAGGWHAVPGKAVRALRRGGLQAVKHRLRYAEMQARVRPVASEAVVTPPPALPVSEPKPPAGPRPLRRFASANAPKFLYIDWSTPRPDRDAGSLTAYHVMQLATNMGYDVTIMPSDLEDLGHYTDALESIGVRCVSRAHYPSARAFLETEGHMFDVVFICRAPIAELYIDDVRRFAPRAKVILNTCDLHFLREIREAEIIGTPEQMAWALGNKKRELETISRCDVSIVLSSHEKEILAAELPSADVRWIPLIYMDPDPVRPGFDERRDFLFIGSFPHVPNIDAALYFAREILPLVRTELPDAVWHVVGNAPPSEVQALAEIPGVVVHGFVHDITPLFRSVRLSIAPLRYGAGIKGKLGTSLAYGVPAIVTSIAAEGMHLVHGEHVMIADEPAAFARHLVDVYRSRERWEAMSVAGQDLVLDTYSIAAGEVRLAELLRSVDPSFRRLEAYDLRSKGAYDLLARYLKPRLEARAALEESLIRRDAESFYTPGFCSNCGAPKAFNCSMMYSYEQTADGRPIPNWREHLDCETCGLTNRLRASLHVLDLHLRPEPDAVVYISEQSTALFRMLQARYPKLVGSEFLGDKVPLGHTWNGFRNEDLTRLTFPDESFDYILSFDVMEHVGDDIAAIRSMYRCLKPGGKLLFAAPFDKTRAKKLVRAILHDDGTVEHILPPEYHGNPVDPENGALCFRYFAWDLIDDLTAAGFREARVLHYWSRDYLYLGREQFLFIAEKPASA